MEHLTTDELDRRWADVEAAVDATPGIDPWCSGPDWQLPVIEGFAPNAPRLLLATDDGTGFAMLARYQDPAGTEVLSGLEPLWGFGCPVSGPDLGSVGGALAAELAAGLATDEATGRPWQMLILPGLPPIGRLDGPSAAAGDAGRDT
ncbi:MAG: hypothetical protein AAFO29_09230, partial [Actinomycetota bacterium]